MGNSMSVDHARLVEVAPGFDTQFDPVELIGTQIPFTDPFAFNDGDFRASYYTPGIARCRSAPAASQRTLASSLVQAEAVPASCKHSQRAPVADIQLLECMSLQRTPKLPA